jgi:hypothetical protein
VNRWPQCRVSLKNFPQLFKALSFFNSSFFSVGNKNVNTFKQQEISFRIETDRQKLIMAASLVHA